MNAGFDADRVCGLCSGLFVDLTHHLIQPLSDRRHFWRKNLRLYERTHPISPSSFKEPVAYTSSRVG